MTKQMIYIVLLVFFFFLLHTGFGFSQQKNQSVEFIKNKSNLTSNVKLTFPYFLLKAFSLSSPDRVVVDVYRLSVSSKDSVPNTSLNEGVSSQVSKKPETKEVEKTKLNLTQERILPGRYTVYLHYSREENKKLIEELAIFLKNKGFEVGGIERFNYKNRDIRYFHSEDKSGAILLKKHLIPFITIYFKNTNINILNLRHKYPNAKKGALELWVKF